MIRKRSLLILLGWSAALFAETPDKHIRVIMDTSKSLWINDPSGYVKLAAAMFYDLALGTFEQRDSFKLALFNPDWPDWKKTGQRPGPITPDLVITPNRDANGRAQFVQRILAMHYDARQTYFSPCFQWALDDFKASGTQVKDNRVIVLITDGVPDWKEADGDALSSLATQLHQENIQVYVIAFSKEIIDNKGWFQSTLRMNQADGVVGDVTERADASKLVTDTLEVFRRSFGYSRESLGASPAQIDVAANATLKRAAVVALFPSNGEVGFQLTPPAGSAMSQEQRESAVPDPHGKGPKPLSYAFKWLVPPEKGLYRFHNTGASPSEVAVLRPIDVEAVIRGRNGGPVNVVMADNPTDMEVLVRSTTGSGDPGKDIELCFKYHYFTKEDSSNPNFTCEKAGALTNEGRVFVIRPRFVKDPRPPAGTEYVPGSKYQGYLEVVIRQNEVTVERSGERMHPVQVYPYVAINPSIDQGTARADDRELLRAADEGCVTFKFLGDKKALREKNYRLGVRLNSPMKLEGPFRGARFRLDGREFDVTVGNGVWQGRMPFDPSSLSSRDHKVCVAVGQPLSGGNKKLKVHFGLQTDSDPYYEELNVISPDIGIQINIAEPDFWQIWKPWLVWLLTLLLMGLMYLFWRSRRLLPPDLAVSLADADGSQPGHDRAEMTGAKLGEASFASRWVGMGQARPIISLTGDKELGWVRPAGEELFLFSPAKGYGLVAEEINGEWRPKEARGDGLLLLEAGKRYRIGTGKDSRLFRLDYSASRPQV
jgi:hypothetical protein